MKECQHLTARIFSRLVCIIIMLAFALIPAEMTLAAKHTIQHHSTHYKKKISKKKPKKKKSTKRKQIPTPVLSSENFDQAYLRFLRHWQIPGSAVAIIKNDRFILSKGYGFADVENHREMTPDSIFRVASVSKAITAIAVLKLAQEGKINLDGKVYEYLNELQPLTDTKPSSRIYTISVRNLLEMSSGWISDHGIDPMMGDWSSRMLKELHNQIPPDCKTAARMMMAIPMQYKPGTHYSYSNFCYCMLGLVINKVTGQPGASGYEAYVKQHLLTPFGITSMQIGDTTPGRQGENEVHYYFHEPKREMNLGRIHDGLPYGRTNLLQKNYSDGGWTASAPDLAKLLRALGKHQILSPQMIRVMITRPYFQENKDSYFAKGFSVKYLRGRLFILKTGSFTGTQALVMLEDDGTSYAALFNAKPSNRKVFVGQLENMLISYAHNFKNS